MAAKKRARKTPKPLARVKRRGNEMIITDKTPGSTINGRIASVNDQPGTESLHELVRENNRNRNNHD